MRVIGGRWRGRRLQAPRGDEVTRPTTDRVREACASMIDAALSDGIAGARVLDAFGGTGALGIEMLSRGAASATFYDRDRRARALIAANLGSLGASRDSWRMATRDVLAAAATGRIEGGPFDLVILDPPYSAPAETIAAFLGDLAAHDQLRPGAVVSFEHASAREREPPDGFRAERSRRYGITMVDLYRWTGR